MTMCTCKGLLQNNYGKMIVNLKLQIFNLTFAMLLIAADAALRSSEELV